MFGRPSYIILQNLVFIAQAQESSQVYFLQFEKESLFITSASHSRTYPDHSSFLAALLETVAPHRRERLDPA